jgi:hypothetical protein
MTTPLSVQMTLTLVDSAGPGVRAFMDLLRGLEGTVNTVSTRITAMVQSMHGMDAGAASAQRLGGALGSIAGTITKVARDTDALAINSMLAGDALIKQAAAAGRSQTELAGLGGTIARAAAEYHQLGVQATLAGEAMVRQAAMGARAATLPFTGRLAGTLGAVTKETEALAIGSMLGGPALAASLAGIKAAGAAVKEEAGKAALATENAAQAMSHSFHRAMLGMAQLWAFFKIQHGFKASIDEAAEFELREARLKALNTPTENAAHLAAAKESSRKLGFVSVSDALEARLAAITGVAEISAHDIDQTINEALKTAILFKLRGDKSEIKDLVRNVYGLAEMRGVTANPEALIASMDFAQRVSAAAGGKLTLKDMETVSRQVKYGGGAMLDDEGWALVYAFANQLKAAGHGGGGGGGGMGVSQAGTATTQLLKWAEVGPKNKETVRLMTAMGLIDPSRVRDDSDTTMVNVAPGAMLGQEQAARNPLAWAREVLGPAVLRLALDNPREYFPRGDTNDPKAIEEALTKIAIQLTAGQGGVNVGNAIALSMLPGPSSRLRAEADLTRGAKGIDAAMDDVGETFRMRMIKVDAALANLKLTVGEKLLPVLGPLVEKFADLVRSIAEFGANHPIITWAHILGAALLAVGLAVAGLRNIFGIRSAVEALAIAMGGAGGAAKTAAVSFTEKAGAVGLLGGAFTRMGGVVTGVLRGFGTMFARAIPLLGALILAWDLGSLLVQWEVGGKKISDWFGTFWTGLVSIASDAWEWIKGIFDRLANLADGLPSRMAKGVMDAAKKASEADRNLVSKGNDAVGDAFSWVTAPARAVRNWILGRGEEVERREHERKGGELLRQQLDAQDAANKESREHEAMAALRAAAANRPPSGVLRPGKDKKGGRGAPAEFNDVAAEFNDVAELAHQDTRLEEDERRRELHKLDVAYRSGAMGVNQYYDAIIAKSSEAAIATVESIRKQIDAIEALGKRDKKGNLSVADQRKVESLQTDQALALARAEDAREEAELKRKSDLAALDQKAFDLEIRRLEVTGRRHQAEQLRLQKQIDLQVKEFELNGRTVDAEKAREVGARNLAAIGFNEKFEAVARIREKERLEQERINELMRAGMLGEAEAAEQRHAAHVQAAKDIDVLIAKLDEWAQKSGNPEDVAKVKQLAVETRGALTELTPMAQKFRDMFGGAFENFFEGLMSGKKKISALFKDLANDIVGNINRAVSKMLSDQLMAWLFGGKTSPGSQFAGLFSGGGGGFNLGGLFGGFSNWLSGLFGGGSGATVPAWTSGYDLPMGGMGGGWGTGNAWGNLDFGGFFANGIDYVPRDMLAVIHEGERIVPRADNQKMMMGGDRGLPPITQNFNITGPIDTRSRSQIAAAAADGLMMARRIR